MLITGEEGLLVSYAKCCGPLPGESVAGFITRGRGITVHRSDCAQLKNLDGSRRITVEWDPTAARSHVGEIVVVCNDRPGLLANISKVCEDANVNISRAEVRNIGDGRAACTLEVSVHNVDELRRLIKNIEKIRGVDTVQRATA